MHHAQILSFPKVVLLHPKSQIDSALQDQLLLYFIQRHHHLIRQKLPGYLGFSDC
jgi:hypothetical protein